MAARAEPAGPRGERSLTPACVLAMPGVGGCHSPSPGLGTRSRLPAPAAGDPFSTRRATCSLYVPSEGTGTSSSPRQCQIHLSLSSCPRGRSTPGWGHPGLGAEQLSPGAVPRNPWCQTNLFCPRDPVTQPAGEGNARDGKYPDSSEVIGSCLSPSREPRANSAPCPHVRSPR